MGRIFIRVGHRVLVIELTANGKVSSRFYKYSNDMPQKLHTRYLISNALKRMRRERCG